MNIRRASPVEWLEKVMLKLFFTPPNAQANLDKIWIGTSPVITAKKKKNTSRVSAENLNTKQAREEIRLTINIAVDKTTHVAESIASYNIADSGASNSENTIFVTALEEKLSQIMNFVKSNTSPKSDFASLTAAIASNLRTIYAEKWIFDTGASNHMTSHFSWLTEKDRLKHVATVELLKGNITNITHVGNYILNNEIELKGTLCVPEFKFNILSISKLTTNMKCYVTFFFS